MNKLVKKIIFAVFVLFSILFISSNVKVKAVVVDETDAISYLGASVRLTGEQGIRFTSRIDFDELLSKNGVSVNDIDYYGYVVAYGECDTEDLYVGATINGKNTLTGKSSTLFSEERKEFTIVLKGFTSDKYLQAFTARAYIIYNDSNYLYANSVITRSIYEVSSAYEENNHDDYTGDICNIVGTQLSGSKDIASTIADYVSSDVPAKTRGVITAISSGSTYSFTISDGTSQIMVYRTSSSDGYQNYVKLGNDILISGTLTKYNGVYEIKNTSNLTVLSSGSKYSRYLKDVSEVFESGSTTHINSVVSGIVQYVSRSNNNMNFTTLNHTNVLLYVDSKWSTYSATNLETDSYYYISGIIGYYNKLEVIPTVASPISSISSISVSNLQASYDIRDFNLSDLILNITLENGKVLTKTIDETMLNNEDLASLDSTGDKAITISCYGKETSANFALTELAVSSIDASVKTRYYVGEELDTSNSYVTVNYENGSSTNIPLTGSYVSGFDTASSGSKSLTITYGGKTTTKSYDVYKKIVIFDVYGAGGNSGATYKYDFVILYNNTDQDIDLSSYYFYYASSNSDAFTNANTRSLTGIIYHNSYYLIRCNSNGDNGSDVPSYNANYSDILMGASGGKVAISNVGGITDVSDERLLDYVAYSAAKNKTYKRTSTLLDTYSQVSADINYYLDGKDSVIDLVITGLKTKYGIGAGIDTTNMEITAIYNSGLQESIDKNDVEINGFNSSSEGTRTLTITYQNYTSNILYSVSDNNGILDVDVYFIDLGDDITDCGESTYIKIGDDIDILIDAGESNSTSANAITTLVNTYCTDHKLEYLIASHAHSDHIGGMSYVLPSYDIENVIEFDYKYGSDENSKTVIGYYLKARQKAEHIYTAYDLITNEGNGSSYEIQIADDISIVLYNTGYLNTTGSDKNAQSIVCTFEAYGTRILFTGDAEKGCEANYASLVGNIDILKVAHHGTYNATETSTLNYIDPEVAIVCNGNYLGNEYGHPTYDALNRLYSYDANMLVYAITGANITDFQTVVSNGPGATAQVLYQYKTSKRSNFYFKCESPSDALNQRNGNIRINITENTYTVTSEFYDTTPLEIKYTDYYTLMVAHWND